MTALSDSYQSPPSSAHYLLQVMRDALCNTPELSAKMDIQSVATIVQGKSNDVDPYSLPGDDCAAISQGNGYQLLAMEGMLPVFVKQDPWNAGWSAVMANISDIAAMGGRASAVVNSYWHHDRAGSDQILKGIRKACEVFGVILAGGHTSLAATNQPGLAVAALGFATHLLSCHHVRPGQQLYMAVDVKGQWHGDNPYWNVVTGKSREQIRAMWNLLPELAESGLITAAKDISNGGVLGTLLMMLELNRYGAIINLNEIPRPEGQVDIIRWLKAFQSFGFILSGDPQHTRDVEQHFSVQGIRCKPIGIVTEQPSVVLKYILDRDEANLEFWNFAEQSFTGMTCNKQENQ